MPALVACFLMAGNGAASGAAAEEGSFKAAGECWYFASASVLDLSVSKSQCNVKITTSDVPSLESGKEGKADGYVFIRTDQSRLELHALGDVRFDDGTFIAYSQRSIGGKLSGEGKQKLIGVSGSLKGGVASCSYRITDRKSDGTWLKLVSDCDWIRPK
ncbi:MAG: hypothetical protein OXH94_08460 [Rhodospirillales bacterium]|nr:hypothetical protein [Rhodospirillales bacterium]